MNDSAALERLVRLEVLMDEARADIGEGFAELRRRLDRLDARVEETEDAIKTARIGWRVTWLLGTAVLTVAGTLGALIAKWLPLFGGLPR
jgi:hypothetical protein